MKFLFIKLRCVCAISLAALLFFACGGSDRNTEDLGGLLVKEELDLIEITPVPLSGKELIVSDKLQTTQSLLVWGNVLIARKMVAAPAYYEMFDVRQGEHLAAFGLSGGGPVEFPAFTRAEIVDRQKGVLGITVPNDDGAYYEVAIDSIFQDRLSGFGKKFHFGMRYNSRYVKLNNGSFAILSTDTEQRIAVIDSVGVLVHEVVDYPFSEEVDLPDDLFGFAFQADIVKNDQLNRVAVFNSDSPNWDIIAFEDNSVSKVISHHLRAPSVRNDSNKEGNVTTRAVAIYADSRASFLSTTSNEVAIYSLFSGKTYLEHGPDAYVSKEVLVFDWNGNVRAKFELQTDVSAIAVSEDNTTLYAYSETEAQNIVVRYDIPD